MASAPLFLGEARAAEKARVRAQQALEQALPVAWRLAPCPQCGKFQKDMLWLERRRLLSMVMVWVGVAALGVGLLTAAFAESVISGVLLGVAVVGAPLIMIWSRTSSIMATDAVRERGRRDHSVFTATEFDSAHRSRGTTG